MKFAVLNQFILGQTYVFQSLMGFITNEKPAKRNVLAGLLANAGR